MSLFIISALLAILIATVHFYVKFVYSYWKRRGVPFIEPSIPFGNYWQLFKLKRSHGQMLHELYNSSNEPVVGLYAGLRPVLLVRDPKIIRDICIKDFQYFWHRGFHYDESVDPLTRNLFSQSGPEWKKMRNLLSPAFTTGKLKGMVDTIIDCGKPLEDYLNQYAVSGKELEVRDVFAQFTTNVIASVGFGLDIDCIKNPQHEFREYSARVFEPLRRNVYRFNSSFVSPFITKLFGVRFVDKDVADFMIDAVRQNLEYREQNNIVRKDFFQLLLQVRNTGKIQDDDDNWTTQASNDGKSLTLEDITAQAYIFLIAAYESSSTTMSFCLHALARSPEIQQKVYSEIATVLKKHNGKLNYESLSEMAYLECCIEETLRMHPPFDVISRQCTKDYKIADSDIVIEKGTGIFVSVVGPHFDPKYYEQPERFMPERFMDIQSANKNSATMPFLTFGDGPRNCIGMRMGKLQAKIGVCLLLRKFSFELGTQHLNNDLVLESKTLVRAPINGIELKIKARMA